MAIIQVGENWQFGSEFELEEVVWQNLSKLLNLKPFKRQYCVKGQFCDILALDEQQRLVVIELKNTEDRYVVQQLTRYYDALKEEAPFSSEIDVGHIRLIAIAPGFHQDTLIDCKYNLLKIELIGFQIQAEVDGFSLLLGDNQSQAVSSLLLQQKTVTSQTSIEVSEPPRKLLDWLSYSSEPKFNALIALRQQVLGFDERMKEMIEPDRILYGKGKTKPCAEIRQGRVYGSNKKLPGLFLWLPDPEGKSKILRIFVETDQTGTLVGCLTYCPRKFEGREWRKLPGFTRIGSYTRIPELYKPFLDESLNCSLPSLVDLALKTWLARL